MSIIIQGSEIINKSPINTSCSKMRYSFPKTTRFNDNHGRGSSKTFQYNLPNVKNFRSTSFGYGQKYDFTSSQDYKSLPYYDSKSDFDNKNPYSPSFSFGISRHFFEKVVRK